MMVCLISQLLNAGFHYLDRFFSHYIYRFADSVGQLTRGKGVPAQRITHFLGSPQGPSSSSLLVLLAEEVAAAAFVAGESDFLASGFLSAFGSSALSPPSSHAKLTLLTML